MDKNRRHFFKNIGKKTAGIAAAATAPALIQLNSLADDLKVLSVDINSKLSKASAEFKGQVQSLNNRLDGAALTMSFQQLQITFIFLLLLISFAIDAGMTAYLTLV